MSILKYSKVIIGLSICFILSAGIFFRFYNIDKKVFWNDEVVTVRILGGCSDSQLARFYNGDTVSAEYYKSILHVPEHFSIKDIISVIVHDGYIQNTPLYYVMLKKWVKVFGDSISTIRLFSAIVSVFALPLMYWLCMELFHSRKSAVIAMLLLAVSPFHILYAQEARPYSLVTVLFLLSSATLLKALRQPTVGGWFLYMITLLLGLYSHLLFVLVAIGHGFYVFIVNRFKFNTSLMSYLIATIISLICFIPWVHLIISNTNYKDFSNYTLIQIPKHDLINQWGVNIRRIFIDTNLKFENSPYYVFPMMGLFGSSIFYFFVNNKNNRSNLFILILLFATAGMLMVYDMIFGGIRSYMPRYVLPSLLGVEIIIAFFFAQIINSSYSFVRYIWRGILLFTIAAGLISCFILSQSEIWWNKKAIDLDTPSFAKVINSSHPSLVILPSYFWLGTAVPLALKLDSTIQIRLSKKLDSFYNPDHFKEIYLIDPSESFLKSIDTKDYKIIKVSPVNLNLQDANFYQLVLK